MNRRVAVLGARYGGQGTLQPPCCPPDRLGEHLGRRAFRRGCQRRVSQERIQVIEQAEIALPVERSQRVVARLGELGGEVSGDTGL